MLRELLVLVKQGHLLHRRTQPDLSGYVAREPAITASRVVPAYNLSLYQSHPYSPKTFTRSPPCASSGLFSPRSITVALALLLVIQTHPSGSAASQVPARWDRTIRESEPATLAQPGEIGAKPASSFSDAAKRAMPSVVNIYTTKEMKMQRHPFMDDPVFRHFFGEQFDAQTREHEAWAPASS